MKTLIIILFLFMLCGCNKDSQKVLGITRVDEVGVCEEYCTLNLKLISEKSLDKIVIDDLYTTSSYDYRIQEINQKIKTDDEPKTFHGYALAIRLFQPSTIKKIKLNIEGNPYQYDIGSFSCLNKERFSNLDLKSSHLECQMEAVHQLNEQIIHQKISFKNLTDSSIIVTSITPIENLAMVNAQYCYNLKNSLTVETKETSLLGHHYLIPETKGIYSLEYPFQVNYIYEGKIYRSIFKVHQTIDVMSVSSLDNYLYIPSICLVNPS